MQKKLETSNKGKFKSDRIFITDDIGRILNETRLKGDWRVEERTTLDKQMNCC